MLTAVFATVATTDTLGTTTTAQLDLLTNTPEKTLTILKEAMTFLSVGHGENLPVLVSNPTGAYELKAMRFNKGSQMVDGKEISLPFSFLGLATFLLGFGFAFANILKNVRLRGNTMASALPELKGRKAHG